MDLIFHFYVDGPSNKFVCLCINNKFFYMLHIYNGECTVQLQVQCVV